MQSKTAAGILAGIASGLGFGIFLHSVSIPMPWGPPLSVMELLARVLGSANPAVGWMLHLILSAAAGGLFGGLLGSGLRAPANSMLTGAAYGGVCWILGALIVIPSLLGLDPFAPLHSPALRTLALGLLAGHEIFGVLLGGVFYLLRRKAFTAPRVYVGLAPSRRPTQKVYR